MTRFYILDLENFVEVSHRCIDVVNKSHWWSVCGLNLRPSSNSITSICSGLVVQVVSTLLCSSWQDFDLHVELRCLSVVAKLLVYLGIVYCVM